MIILVFYFGVLGALVGALHRNRWRQRSLFISVIVMIAVALFGAALTRTFYLFIPGVLFAAIGYGTLMLAYPLLTRRKSTTNL